MTSPYPLHYHVQYMPKAENGKWISLAISTGVIVECTPGMGAYLMICSTSYLGYFPVCGVATISP